MIWDADFNTIKLTVAPRGLRPEAELRLGRIYPMRYYAIFLYTDNKQDYIILFKPFENRLSHGVIVNLAF
jgi:hypothetical protein